MVQSPWGTSRQNALQAGDTGRRIRKISPYFYFTLLEG